ncbi:hypothetical protein TIFTF001_017081 [Ficus carica]|uniref:Josephin-like protein n=1 Tax=Ficus carica TaxID=3494 RepID=A0AA88D7Y3_FICCA|nr:hypothetical protein TIFTF001_017081 [Ficus carica]
MSRKDRRVCFSPDVNDNLPMSDLLKHSASIRARDESSCSHKRVNSTGGVWGLRLPKESKYYSPVEFLRSLRAKFARAICLASKRRSSGKVSASNLTRCRSVSDPIDSHRAEALEDCIEFLNSSASLKRTNSVSSNY